MYTPWPAIAGFLAYLVEHLPVGVGVEPAAHVQPLHHHDAAGVGRVDRATHHDSGPVGGLDLGREAPASIGAELAIDGVRGGRPCRPVPALLVARGPEGGFRRR